MSGHNKWSTIKHKKGKADAARSKIFTKLIKEITVAARMGGGDESGNPRLRKAILEARSNNMPADNIIRAVKKGTGELEGVSYDEITYEGYGPEGVALLIDVLTDNRNRCVAEIRSILNKGGGKMAEPNSVGWMFSARGQVSVEAPASAEDALMEAALEAGADDVESHSEGFEVMTPQEIVDSVKDAIEAAGFKVTSAKYVKVASTTVKINDKKRAETMLRLMENLDDSDDVRNVWANFDIDDDIIAGYEG